MAHHHKTGKIGEKLALEYLSKNGYSILHINWRHIHWEVDIIGSRGNILHFVEVKTRRSLKFGNPEEGVSRKKLKNLIDAGEEFMHQNPLWKQICFNILSINLCKGKPPQYFLIEDVYL